MKGKRIPWEQRAEILHLLSHSVLVQVPYSCQPVVGAGVGLCGHNCVAAAGAGAQRAMPCAGCLCSSRGVPGWWPVPTVCVTIAWLLAEERAGTAIPLPFKPTHCWFSMLEVGLFLPGPQTRSAWASHCGILITHTLFPVKLHGVLPSHMLGSEHVSKGLILVEIAYILLQPSVVWMWLFRGESSKHQAEDKRPVGLWRLFCCSHCSFVLTCSCQQEEG